MNYCKKCGKEIEEGMTLCRECEVNEILFGNEGESVAQVAKAPEIRQMLAECGSTAHIEADGGVNSENAIILAQAGVNVLVAGTSVFRHPQGAKVAIDGLHDAAKYLPR